MMLDTFFDYLVRWLSGLAERRYGLLAGCAAAIALTGLFVGGVWLAWTLLT